MTGTLQSTICVQSEAHFRSHTLSLIRADALVVPSWLFLHFSPSVKGEDGRSLQNLTLENTASGCSAVVHSPLKDISLIF